MKTTFLAILVTVGICCSVLGGNIKDPINDFLFDNSDPDDAFALSRIQRVFELKLDINNDEKPVVFLSMNGMGAKGVNTWQAYIPDKGNYRKVDQSEDNFYFRRDVFYVGYVDSIKKFGLLAYISGGEGGDLNFYQILNCKLSVQNIGKISPSSDPKDKKIWEKYFGKPGNERSLHDHPVKTLTLDDLRKAGYDVDAAISAAKAKIHPYEAPR